MNSDKRKLAKMKTDFHVFEVIDPLTGEVLSVHDDVFNANMMASADDEARDIRVRKLNPFEVMKPEEASNIIRALNDKGVSRPSIATVLEVTPLTITNWINRRKAGRLSPRQMVKLNQFACLFLK